jgi:hypothetical protein
MTLVAIRVCHTQEEAQTAIVRVALQLGIPERDVSVTRCEDLTYVHEANTVRDSAIDVLLVVGRKE